MQWTNKKYLKWKKFNKNIHVPTEIYIVQYISTVNIVIHFSKHTLSN